MGDDPWIFKTITAEPLGYKVIVRITFYLIHNFWKFKWFNKKSNKKDVTTAAKTLSCIFADLSFQVLFFKWLWCMFSVFTSMIPEWIINLVRTQRFPKNEPFLTPDTDTYVLVSGSKKCWFFGISNYFAKHFCKHCLNIGHKVFWCFQGVEKGRIGNKWVKGKNCCIKGFV